MTESLRRQKILLERELIRLVINGKYVKTENGYRLEEQPISQEELYKKQTGISKRDIERMLEHDIERMRELSMTRTDKHYKCRSW